MQKNTMHTTKKRSRAEAPETKALMAVKNTRRTVKMMIKVFTHRP